MAQFDVHANPDRLTRSDIPYLVEVQSDALAASGRRVVVPLARSEALAAADPVLNPIFRIEGTEVALLPVDITAVPASALGDPLASLAGEGDALERALRLLLRRV